MSTGCKFVSQQGGYCRTTNTGVVEDKCFLEDNRCYTEPDYVKKYNRSPTPSPKRTIAVSPVPSPTREAEYSPKTSQALMVSTELQYISGPLSWYYYEFPEIAADANNSKFMKRSFHFFGDVHYGKGGTCEDRYKVKCSNINVVDGKIDLASRCEDIIFLLKKMFDNSYSNKKYTDFYLEVPFRLQGAPEGRLDLLAQKIQSGQELNTKELRQALNLDYIQSMYVLFNSCFLRTANKCSYSPYIRFHNVDLRQAVDVEYQGLISLNSYLALDSVHFLIDALAAYYQSVNYAGMIIQN